MNFLFRLRNRMQDMVHALEGRIQDTANPLTRALLALRLMLSYIGLALSYSLSMLFSSPQKSFSFVNNFEPDAGYTVSYSQHRSMQRNLKVGAVSSIIVIIIVNIVNGVLISKEFSMAAEDGSVQSVSVIMDSGESGATAEYVVTLNIAENIDPSHSLYIYSTTEGGDYTTDGVAFQNASVTSSDIAGISFDNIEQGHVAKIDFSEVLTPNQYTFTLLGLINPPVDGTYRLAISSVGLFPEQATLSEPLSIASAGGPPNGEDTNCDAPSVISNVQAVPLGSNIWVQWDAYENATAYYVQWYPGGEYELREQYNNGMLTNYAVPDLVLNTEYSIRVVADTNECTNAAVSEIISSITDSEELSDQQFEQPTTPKKLKKKRSVVVKWDAVSGVDTYGLQLLNKKKKVLKSINNIDADKTKHTLKKLKAGTVYFVQLRGTYFTGETTQYSNAKKFRTRKK